MSPTLSPSVRAVWCELGVEIVVPRVMRGDVLGNDAIGRGGRCHFSRRPQKLAVGEFFGGLLSELPLDHPETLRKQFPRNKNGENVEKRQRERKKKEWGMYRVNRSRHSAFARDGWAVFTALSI